MIHHVGLLRTCYVVAYVSSRPLWKSGLRHLRAGCIHSHIFEMLCASPETPPDTYVKQVVAEQKWINQST